MARSIVSSLNSASCEAKIVSDYETILALRRAKPHLSCEAKARAPLCASNVADSASLSLPAPSAKNLCRGARDKAPSANDLGREARNQILLGANSEAILASLEGKALL